MLLQIHEPGKTPLPHENDDEVAVGIDLGTTRSAIALSNDGKATLLPNRKGKALTPSVVGRKDSQFFVGDAAFEICSPHHTVRSIKKFMGEPPQKTKEALNFPFPLIEDSSDHISFLLGDKETSPEEISSQILRALKADAEELLEHRIQKAVITVPAYFSENARTATRQAATLAGFDILRLLSEPTAAALAYGLEKAEEGYYVVYDLGGGTFDVSVLHLEEGVFEVKSVGGDTNLGGDSLDEEIYHHLLSKNHFLNEVSPSELLPLCRDFKESLGEYKTVQREIFIKEDAHVLTLSRAALEMLAQPLISRTLNILRATLLDAGLDKSEIKDLILVGGSTRLAPVQKALESFLGKPPLCRLNPEEVVARGAALHAETLLKGTGQLLLDVTPLSLGIELMGGVVEKIIPRNTSIPCSIAQEFTTHKDGQTALKLTIVQGEREFAKDCRKLGTFTLKGIPPMVAGLARIRVTFTLDADGLLSVTALETTKGVPQTIHLQPAHGLTEDEMIHMLKESYEHGEEDLIRRTFQIQKMEVEDFLTALETALEMNGKELLEPREIDTLQKGMADLRTFLKTATSDDLEDLRAHYAALTERAATFLENRLNSAILKSLQTQKV